MSQNLILSQFSQWTNNASNKSVLWLTLCTIIIIIVIIGIRRNINNACCDRRAWPTREFANMFQWNIFDVMIIMTMSLIFVCQFLFLSDVAAFAALKKCTTTAYACERWPGNEFQSVISLRFCRFYYVRVCGVVFVRDFLPYISVFAIDKVVIDDRLLMNDVLQPRHLNSERCSGQSLNRFRLNYYFRWD